MKILDIPQSGKRGLTVSQHGRYGQISRAYAMPANPQTASQMQVRATFGTVASAWDGLTEAQRQAWIAAAATRQTKTRCGTSGPMTGLQFGAPSGRHQSLRVRSPDDQRLHERPLQVRRHCPCPRLGGMVAPGRECPLAPGPLSP